MTAVPDPINNPYADGVWKASAHKIGWPIPLIPVAGKKGKPLPGWTGYDGAYPNGPQLADWAERKPSWNYAMRVRRDVIGIDVDMYDGKAGREELSRLEWELGELPLTIMSTSRTDGSGIRLFRAAEKHWHDRLGSSIEIVQHDHRYAVWEGSIHPNGGVYGTIDQRTGEENSTFTIDDLPELPQAWQDRLEEQHVPEVYDEYDGPRYADWTPEQRRIVDEHVQVRLQYRLRDLTESKEWPIDYVQQLPGGTERGWEKLQADIAQTFRTLAAEGWSKWTENGLLALFLKYAPVDHDWTRFVAVAKWNSQKKPAVGNGRIQLPRFVEDAGTAPELADVEDATLPEQKAAAVVEDDRNKPIDWTALLEGPEVPPDFVVGQMLERGQQMALIGAAKVGKSLLSLDWAACIAAGKPFLGDEAHEPLRVLYVDHENTQADLRRRVRALGYAPSDLTNFTYLSFPAISNLDTMEGAMSLRAEIDHYDPQVVFLDTVSRMIGGPENDSDTWLNLYRLTLKDLKRRQIALVRLDHFGKDTDRGARGSSAKEQDVDQVWELKAAGPKTFDLKRTHSRTGAGEEFIRFERQANEEKTWVRHERPERAHAGAFMFETYSATVLDAVKKLDAAGCPVAGRPVTVQFALDNNLGLLLAKTTWEQIVKARKELAQKALAEA